MSEQKEQVRATFVLEDKLEGLTLNLTFERKIASGWIEQAPKVLVDMGINSPAFGVADAICSFINDLIEKKKEK